MESFSESIRSPLKNLLIAPHIYAEREGKGREDV